MRPLITTILLLITLSIQGQSITFSTEVEIQDALVYLNKLRHSTELVKQETGVELKKVCNRDLTIDSTLQELARLRVIEMIENGRIGHKTKYDTDYYSECCAYNYEGSLESHIVQYIVDYSVSDKGHRYTLLTEYNRKVGFYSGTINGKTYSCFLFSDGIYEITPIAMK